MHAQVWEPLLSTSAIQQNFLGGWKCLLSIRTCGYWILERWPLCPKNCSSAYLMIINLNWRVTCSQRLPCCQVQLGPAHQPSDRCCCLHPVFLLGQLMSCRRINLPKAQILSCHSYSQKKKKILCDSPLPTDFQSMFFLFLFRKLKNDLFPNRTEIKIK